MSCRRKKFAHGGVGRALENDRIRQQNAAKLAGSKPSTGMTGVADSQAARSVLEQSSLDDFISQAALGQRTFDGTRGGHLQPVDCTAQLVSSGPTALSLAEKERVAAARRVQVPIPRRPPWHEGISHDELAALEGEAFLAWRRGLALIEEGEELIMTPYERNLDFWRQLWRCVERADLLVQILDARDPEFYRCHDLERWVIQSGKKAILLINKADFLSPELRQRWQAHFDAAGVDVIFFSALRELHRQQKAAESSSTGCGESTLSVPHGPLEAHDDGEVLDCTRLLEELVSRMPKTGDESDKDASGKKGVVGFVGYPNVGKSSVINALVGAKKVSVSRTPGKTKHLQTLEMPEAGLTLCDCPGLVFPSVVATKAHLVINGTTPLTELKEAMPPAKLVIEKVGEKYLMDKYGITADNLLEASAKLGVEPKAPGELGQPVLAAMAMTRGHVLNLKVPDEGWSARKILREYVTGEILWCEPPRGFDPPPRASAQASSSAEAVPATEEASNEKAAAPAAEASDDDFSDLDDFLNESRGVEKKTKHTKGNHTKHKREKPFSKT